jgi:Predicted Zn-dependent peptidases
MAMAFPGPSRKSSQRLAAEIWAAIASGLGGRLFETLRDKRSLAYTVVASSWQKGRAGALVTYIATAPEREEEARSAMLEELSRFAADRVTADELNRARNYLAGQVDVERQSASALASEIVEAWLTGNGLSDLEGTADRYRAVTAEQVLAVAGQFPSGVRAEGSCEVWAEVASVALFERPAREPPGAGKCSSGVAPFRCARLPTRCAGRTAAK